MSNVTALPGFSVPSPDPVQEVVDLLEEALNEAKAGKLIAVAIVGVERDPQAFVTRYHGGQSSRHSLVSGVLALGYQIGKVFSEND